MSEKSSRIPTEESLRPTPEQYVDGNNQHFVASLIHPGDTVFEQAVWDACTDALTLTDKVFGPNAATLANKAVPRTRDTTYDIWSPYAMPTFYHNGDGTRLAMMGTASYMDFTRSQALSHGLRSPYHDRHTYLLSMLTAAYDDIVFGMYGRGGDEKASAQFAQQDLAQRGFPGDVIDDVTVSIIASTFNESTGKQSVDTTKGAAAIQEASVIGDLWALGTAQGPLNTLLLGIENLWKRDTAHMHGQVLRVAAINAWDRYGWNGESLADFIQLIDANAQCRTQFAQFLTSNPHFILNIHAYTDDAVNRLMLRGKQESAILQSLMGQGIEAGRLSVQQAFHCALSYAHAKRWEVAERGTPVAFPGPASPAAISTTLLTRRTMEEIANPVNAERFYQQYGKEIGMRRVPRQRQA